MLPRRARVYLGAMAMKGVLHPPKLQHYWDLTIRQFSVISRTLIGGYFSSVEVQSVYFTTPADWARHCKSSSTWDIAPTSIFFSPTDDLFVQTSGHLLRQKIFHSKEVKTVFKDFFSIKTFSVLLYRHK